MKKRLPYLRLPKSILILLSFLYAHTLFAQIAPSLMAAIQAKDLPAVKQSVKTGENIHATDEQGISLIMWAVYSGDLKIVKYLIRRGAERAPKATFKQNGQKIYGSLPAIAAGEGDLAMLIYFVDQLGLDINTQDWNSSTNSFDGWTPLQHALANLRIECAKFLEVRRADKEIARAQYASFYLHIGNYPKAQAQAHIARKEMEEKLGKQGTEYAMRLFTEGSAYIGLGDYGKALILIQEAIEIDQSLWGEFSPQYPIHATSLGRLYLELGDPEKTLNVLKKAMPYVEKKYGRKHSIYNNLLHLLGQTYYHQGAYDQALQILETTAENSREHFGKDHYDYAHKLQSLTKVLIAMEAYERADQVIKEALKAFPEREDAAYGDLLYTQGTLLAATGKTFWATASLTASAGIVQNSMGDHHPTYCQRANMVAHTLYELGAHKEAFQIYQESNEIGIDLIQGNFKYFSESQQRLTMNKIVPELKFLPSLMLAHPERKELVGISLDNQLVLKGLMQRNRTRLMQNLRDHPDEEVQNQFQSWNDLQRQLSGQFLIPLENRSRNLESLKSKAENLEIQLAEHSIALQNARKKINWQDIQRALALDEVAIEFAHFPYVHDAKTGTEIVYVAFVISPQLTNPIVIPLFEEGELKNALQHAHSSQNVSELYGYRGVKPRKNQLSNGSAKLVDLIWKPIFRYLPKDVSTIHYSPSGLLHRINLSAISWNNEDLVGDLYKLTLLNSTRSLAFSQASNHQSNKKVILMGGIDYETSANNQMLADLKPDSLDSLIPTDDLFIVPPKTRGNQRLWQALPATMTEVRQIKELLSQNDYQVTLQEGQAANESFLKKLDSSPRILHFATHGYFFPDLKERVQQELISSDILLPIQKAEDPMIRSGLILAGANHTWQGNAISTGQEDGILTAYEISKMDLSETELVVLSACETGLGDIEGSEGVYGLQRAFKIAGAKYILMSLWQVPDQPTQELMTAFYTEWLRGSEIRTALQHAQRKMRAKYQEPYYWAGFVLVE